MSWSETDRSRECGIHPYSFALIHCFAYRCDRLLTRTVVGPTQTGEPGRCVMTTSFLHATDGAAFRPTAERLAPSTPAVEGRQSPLDWIRARRAERETRRAEVAHQRAAQRLGALGNNWRGLCLQAPAGIAPVSFPPPRPGGLFPPPPKDPRGRPGSF